MSSAVYHLSHTVYYQTLYHLPSIIYRCNANILLSSEPVFRSSHCIACRVVLPLVEGDELDVLQLSNPWSHASITTSKLLLSDTIAKKKSTARTSRGAERKTWCLRFVWYPHHSSLFLHGLSHSFNYYGLSILKPKILYPFSSTQASILVLYILTQPLTSHLCLLIL